MTGIFYIFIVLPIIFMIILAFIFSSSISAIQVQQLKLNCPYPINGGVPVNGTLNSDGRTVSYNVTWDTSNTNYHLTTFHCAEDSPTSVTDTVYTTSNNWFNVGLGYLAYFANSITAFFSKILALFNLIYLMINAPAQVTGLVWFTYVNVVFLAFIAIGLFMVVRG